jgi:hypothetical protein
MRICIVMGLVLMAVVRPGGARADNLPDQFRVWGKQAKADAYLADARLDLPGERTAEVTEAELGRGFVVFSGPFSRIFAPDFIPAVTDRCTALAARDCPGQYGPITFCIFTLRRADYGIAVSDLVEPGGRKIGAKNLDVRAVRYVKVTQDGKAQTIPLLLESIGTKTVAPNRLQQFWITYSIPEGTPPGTYAGKVRILVGGAETLAIPLRLQVYPFKLTEPDVNLYIYYNNSTEPADAARVRSELADQRCHGMNTTTLDVPVTRDGDISREAVQPVLDAFRDAGFARPRLFVGLYNRITAEWLNTPDQSIKMWGPWFRYYPFSERLDRRFVETVKMLRDEAAKRGFKIFLSVADEAGSHAWTTEATQHYYDLLKAQVPDMVRELSVGGGWAMGRDEDELWRDRINIWTTNRWLPDKLALVRRNDPKAKIQLYNMAGGGSTPGGIESARALYGFFNWKAGAYGSAQWCYYHSATPAENYTWPSVNPSESGVPTLRWEAVREGAKDRRYIETLERRLAGKSGPVAEEARRFLADISARIVLRTDQYDPIGGGRVPVQPPGTYDQWRDRIAGFIMKL